jgi:hypothetical protein
MWLRAFLTSALHAPAALSPGKELPVPTGAEAGWAPEPICITRAILSRIH